MEIGSIPALVLSIATIINIIFACIVVFIERRDIGSTWAWLMVLFFIPVLGFIVYVFFGRQLKQKNYFQLTTEELAFFQDRADKQFQEIHKRDGILQQYSKLVKMNLKSSNALVTTDNEVKIYHDGQAKFDALFADIRRAADEINIEYYIIKPDTLGKKLRDLLTEKAREGVKVRILYDEVGSRRMSRSFFRELIKHGGEVASFFPSWFRLINLRINNRNHRKLCIIDGEIGYVGGFNVGDEYLGLNESMGYWRDTHLRITGEAVALLQGRFIMDWSKATNYEREHIESHFSFRPDQHPGNSAIQIISSGPNSQTEHLKLMYLKLMMQARKSIFIQTPYFIPDASFMDACKMALLSGVDVRIMIPNKPDHPFVYSATLAHVGELLPYGVKILQYEKGFMHAKSIVVDQEVASVGTMNIDPRSFRLNFEVNALVYDAEVAKVLHELFLQDSESCMQLTKELYRKRSNVAKFKQAIARLLSPIL